MTLTVRARNFCRIVPNHAIRRLCLYSNQTLRAKKLPGSNSRNHSLLSRAREQAGGYANFCNLGTPAISRKLALILSGGFHMPFLFAILHLMLVGPRIRFPARPAFRSS